MLGYKVPGYSGVGKGRKEFDLAVHAMGKSENPCVETLDGLGTLSKPNGPCWGLGRGAPARVVLCPIAVHVQGYLAHKKPPPPRTLQWHFPRVV